MKRSSLNHAYRLVWNEITNTFVAVAETTRGRGKKSRSGRSLNAIVSLAAGAFLAGFGSGSFAQTSPTVVDGAGQAGYFVESGTLSLADKTLTNFSTKGGSGSGGGAGLGGAIFINSGASAVLNNVNFVGNMVTGGNGGTGSTGGSLNNRGGGSSNGSNGANASNSPAGAAFVNGGNGTNGYGGISGGNASNGIGGKGGNGGNGSIGLPITADSVKAGLDIIYDAGMLIWDGVLIATAGTNTALYTGIAAEFTSAAALSLTQATVGLGVTYVISELGIPFTALAATYTGMAAEEAAVTLTSDAAKLIVDTAKLAADTAYLTAITVTNLAVGSAGNGGAGGNAGNAGKGSAFFGGGAGGDGGNGGDAYVTSAAQGGAGGAGGAGGGGGFGAGGGSGGNGGMGGSIPAVSVDVTQAPGTDGGAGAGGTGGFGAGAGAGGAGYGALAGAGAGGSGFGGAIFVRNGGALTITGTANFEQNAALGGDGQIESATVMAGAPGSALGTDLFIMKGSNVVLAPGGNNVITFNGSIADDSGIAGVADGNGAGLTVRDGLVVFNGTNTYSGQTKIGAGGVLQAVDGTGIATNSNINLAGGVLQSNGLFNRFVGTSSPRIQWTGDGGFAAQGGALEVKLSNNQTLTWGASSFVPNGSKLLFGSASATDAVTFDNAINLNGATRTILVTANDAELSGVDANIDTATLNGVLSNGGLIVGDATHTGTLILNKANTYTGGTTVNAGTLRESATGFLADSGFLTVDGATAVFDLGADHNDTVGLITLKNGGTLAGSGTSQLSSTGTFELQDGTVNVKLGGDGIALNKTTAGTVTLNNQNTYTGLTTVSAGKLAYGTDNAIATGAVTITGAGAELALGAFNDSVGTVVLDNAGLISGTGTLTSTGSFEMKDGTVNAKLGGDGIALNKTTAGTVTLNNQNTYTGLTTVSAGKLNYGTDNAIASGAVTVNGATAELAMNTFNDTVGLVTLDGGGLISGTGSTSGTLTSTDRFEVKSGTVSAKLGGDGIALNKTTAGTVTLNNQNSYTGLTTVSAGTLAYGINNALATGNVTVDGATAVLAMGAFTDSVGTVTLDHGGLISGTGTLASTTSFEVKDGTVNVVLAGTGIGLNKTTAGTVTLTNQNTYTGVTQIDAGTVNLTGSLASPTVNVASGATLNNTNAGLAANAALTNAGTVNLGADDTIATFSNTGTLNGAGKTLTAVTYALNAGSVINANLGTGTVTANGAVALNGTSAAATVNINSGTTTLGSAERLLNTAAVTVAASSNLVLGGAEQIGQLFGAGRVDLTAGGLKVDSGNFSGVLFSSNASYGLNKVSSGVLSLSGANTFTGLTQIDAGTVNLTGSLASTAVNVATGATLNNVNAGLVKAVIATVDGSMVLGASQQIGQLLGSGMVDLTNGGLSVDAGNFSGVVQSANSTFGLTKLSSGTLTLSGKSTYAGNTNVNAGTLILAGTTAPNLSASTAVTVASGANLVINGDNTVASVTSSGQISGSKTLTASIYKLNDGSQVSAKLGNVATGSTLFSNGAVTLSNSVAATSINVQTGTLSVAAPDILSHAATVDIASPATLSLTGGNQTVKTLNGAGKMTLNGYNLNVTDGGAFSGVTSTTGSLTKTGTGTLALSGNNSFTQGLVVDAGKIIIAAGTVQTTSETTVNNGSTLVNNGTITNSVVVNAGGTLMGSGTFTGNLTGNGTTAPGNSPGVLTVAGNYTENGTLQIEIGGLGGVGASNGHDQVAVGGKTVLNSKTGALQLKRFGVPAFEPSKGNAFTIIQGTPGSISGSFATFSNEFTNDMILNRSTGQMIGTGLLTASTGSNLLNAFPGATANLQSMIGNLKIGDHQYAGGDLLPLLLSASTPADVAVLANRASPEAYAGFADYAGRVSNSYAYAALNMIPLVKTEKYSVFVGNSNFDSGSSSSINQADYAINSKGMLTGARVAIDSAVTVGLYAGIDSGSLDSTYLNSTVKGNVYGFFGEFNGGENRKLSITGNLSMASYTSEGTRATAGTSLTAPGLSRFKEVGSSSTMASLAFKYRAVEEPTFTIQPELRLNYLNSKVNGFTETNANTMQALSVESQSVQSFVTEVAVSGRFQVNPSFSLGGRLSVSHTGGDAARDISAAVVGETTGFSVRAPGMGSTSLGLGLGAAFSVNDKLTVTASYQRAMAADAKGSNSFYLNAALNF
jgi:autotransporter-associated beta strand protein